MIRKRVKGKAIPVQACTPRLPGVRGYQISRQSAHEGGKVVSQLMSNSNETIGNRTRDLPACSAVTQPTVPQGAALRNREFIKKYTIMQVFLY